MNNRKMSFEQAKAKYTNRYTMEHVPAWAAKPCGGNGLYYAPQFKSDKEWYDNTLFYGEIGFTGKRGDCYTNGQTFPLGNWLDSPYKQS